MTHSQTSHPFVINHKFPLGWRPVDRPPHTFKLPLDHFVIGMCHRMCHPCFKLWTELYFSKNYLKNGFYL